MRIAADMIQDLELEQDFEAYGSDAFPQPSSLQLDKIRAYLGYNYAASTQVSKLPALNESF